MALKVSSQLVGGTERMRNPAQQGSGWACNCYPEHNGKNFYQASLPGLKLVGHLPVSGAVRGCYVPSVGLTSNSGTPDLFVVVGTSLIRIDNALNTYTVGTVGDTTARVTFAESGGERALLLIADGVNLWYYNLKVGGSLQQITLPDRPNQAGVKIKPSHVAVVGGSIVVNDQGSGFMYYSIAYPLNDTTRKMFEVDSNGDVIYSGGIPQTDYYTSDQHVFEDDYHVQQFFNGESSSDVVNGIMALGSALYVFGQKTVEIWQRGSGEYQTWQRTSYTVNGANGLDAPFSLAHSGDTVYYLGSGEAYGKAVMCAVGANYTKISEDWLDDKLLGETSAYGYSYSHGGHNFYVLQLNSKGETWVYDSTEKAWHERRSTYFDGTEMQWRCQGMAWFKGVFYAFCNDGGIYTHSSDYFAEQYTSSNYYDGHYVMDGTSMPVTRHRQTSVIVDDYRPFILEELSVECNVGTWGNDYNSSEPTVTLEVSDDGGNTFYNYDYVLAGRSGDYSQRVRFLNLGINRLCVVRVTFSNECDFVMTAMALRTRATGAVI